MAEPKEEETGTGEETERILNNNPGIVIHFFLSALDLLLCAAAIVGLIVTRLYYLPGKTTWIKLPGQIS